MISNYNFHDSLAQIYVYHRQIMSIFIVFNKYEVFLMPLS